MTSSLATVLHQTQYPSAMLPKVLSTWRSFVQFLGTTPVSIVWERDCNADGFSTHKHSPTNIYITRRKEERLLSNRIQVVHTLGSPVYFTSHHCFTSATDADIHWLTWGRLKLHDHLYFVSNELNSLSMLFIFDSSHLHHHSTQCPPTHGGVWLNLIYKLEEPRVSQTSELVPLRTSELNIAVVWCWACVVGTQSNSQANKTFNSTWQLRKVSVNNLVLRSNSHASINLPIQCGHSARYMYLSTILYTKATLKLKKFSNFLTILYSEASPKRNTPSNST